MNCKSWYKLRHKENKTEQEKLLLELRKVICAIVEIIVGYDKCNYSEGDAINKIRDILSEVIEKI